MTEATVDTGTAPVTATTCTECNGPADEYNSTECTNCGKPVCTDCRQQCMASSFDGCPACHPQVCPTSECIDS